MIDILIVILVIVLGLMAIFLVFEMIFCVLYSFSDSYLFEHFFKLSATICLKAALILFAVALLLLVGIGVASLVTFSEGV